MIIRSEIEFVLNFAMFVRPTPPGRFKFPVVMVFLDNWILNMRSYGVNALCQPKILSVLFYLC